MATDPKLMKAEIYYIIYSLYIWILTQCDAQINAHYKKKVEKEEEMYEANDRVPPFHSTSIYSVPASD